MNLQPAIQRIVPHLDDSGFFSFGLDDKVVYEHLEQQGKSNNDGSSGFLILTIMPFSSQNLENLELDKNFQPWA